jgi:CubicO group peptidase (beta-lactamase class C family)
LPLTLRFFTVTLLIHLLVWTPAKTQTSASLPSEKVARIDKAVAAFMSRLNIPGLSIAVATDNQLRWQKGYGLADMENLVPAKAATVYRLASVSKPITATAVMQLVERGKIDLDAPVQKYVPSFPQKAYPVTVRDLLRHTSGIRHYKGDEENSTRYYGSLMEALTIFKNDPLEHQPGLKFTYSTYGYTLLGVVVEAASGMKFTDYLRENIFKPAGMSRTRSDSVREIIPNRARGYVKTDKGDLSNAGLADTSYKIPGGGLVSTVEDLIKFAGAEQNGTLVRKETFGMMSISQVNKDVWERTFAPQKIPAGKEPPSYGFGWIIGTEKRKDAIWHGGVQQGVTTLVYILPKERLTLAVMMNLEGEGTAIENFGDEVAEILLAGADTPTSAAKQEKTQRLKEVKIYFYHDPGEYIDLAPVTRSVNSTAPTRAAIEALLKGPTAAERQRGFDSLASATEFRIGSLRISGGTARINFVSNRSWAGWPGDLAPARFKKAVELTLKQFPSVRQVVVSLNGDEKFADER